MNTEITEIFKRAIGIRCNKNCTARYSLIFKNKKLRNTSSISNTPQYKRYINK